MATLNRRNFLKKASATFAGAAAAAAPLQAASEDLPYKISLAEWSLHRNMLDRGDMDALNFGPIAKNTFNIDAVEYVNQMFFDKATDMAYLAEMRRRAEWEGVDSLLIMIDGEGRLGEPNQADRIQAVENHHKWVEAARFIGCHSIRVNARSDGSPQEQAKLVADGLRRLTEFAADYDINVIVENHGGLSGDAEWLSGVMERVDHPRCGTLPDFGNFAEDQDIYEGVRLMMPYAEGVSAKAYAFDEQGYETTIDYPRMMQIVAESGYDGYIGIEYEGDQLSEVEGIKATKALLDRIRFEMA